MIKLKEVTINKYKVFTKPQHVIIEDDITALVGMNESGKTAFLETLAKLNYFDKDPEFAFNPLSDFPRSELKKYENEIDETEVLLCKFELEQDLLSEIEKDIGKGTLTQPYFYFGAKYNNRQVWRDFEIDISSYLTHVLHSFIEDLNILDFIRSVNNFIEISEKAEMIENPRARKYILELYNYVLSESYNWKDPLKGYIAKNWFKPNLPLFWYFDEYYSLPSRINLADLLTENPGENESLKTARALFKLAKININELIEASNFERFIAELENTANIITEKIYKYWSTNKNLELEFEIERQYKETGVSSNNAETFETKYLNIRIRDSFNRVSLPLHKRSKGFNWFFSFIVWFSQIEKKSSQDFILLLDEPGLNLHAIAQKDLLRFLRDLSKDYQLIYTTHSPFMLSRENLNKIRTITENETGSEISTPENETDFETLLPIQVSIGYEIADNLLLKKRNLVVKQVAELILLEAFSEFLNSTENKGLNRAIAITPLGGFSSIMKFVTLMSGYNIDLILLTSNDINEKISDIEKKLNSIIFYTDFAEYVGEIFDLFEKNDFLKILYSLYPSLKGLLKEDEPEKPFSYYLQEKFNVNISLFDFANEVVKEGISKQKFSDETLNNFASLFSLINKKFGFAPVKNSFG